MTAAPSPPDLVFWLVHSTLALAGLLLYVLTTRARRQHRHPSAALVWVLAMVIIPYLAIPLFLAVGAAPRRRPPYPVRPPAPQIDLTASTWAPHMMASLGLPEPTLNQEVHFHADGGQAQAALVAMIAGARKRILLSTFILATDAFGDAIVRTLAARAHAGVEVCVLLDAFALLRGGYQQLRALRIAGVKVRWAVSLRDGQHGFRINPRYHRKQVICDGATLWTGGRNLANEYFTSGGAVRPWEDLSFDIRGPLAGQAERIFEQDWRAAGGAPLRSPDAESVAGVIPAQIVSSGPDRADDNVYAVLLAGAFQASRRIIAVTPYFVPDDALLTAWRLACRRGVQVTLLVPVRSNHRLADRARGRALRELCEAGAHVYLFPRMIHAKAIVIDDVLALCGSVNLDGRSLFLNFEMMIAFYGRKQINWVLVWIQEHVRVSPSYRPRKPSWAREIGESLIRVFGFQL